MPAFSHLHLHTQYSLLDGASRIEDLMKKVNKDEQGAVAISDHGNMFGVFEFVAEAHKQGVKPIVGCEFYLTEDRFEKKGQHRYHQILWAKNAKGYKNLSKLCSLGYLEGFHYKPRIDKDLIRQHREGLMASTCCIQGEVPRTILDKGEEEGEALFKEWLDIFGDDYYIELQRHNIEDQDKVNKVLLEWSKKHHVKKIATNDVHYLEEEDSKAHDILLCLQTGSDLDDPNRLQFSSQEYYFKTRKQMEQTFGDIPEALENTQEIVDKVEPLDLKRDIMLPHYKLPEGFETQEEYLRHLTFEGAKQRYGKITQEVKERLNHELKIISEMGFAGYFLIVQDFVEAARELNVIVGPGRGSAAGSAVAYCNGITNIDPIRYNLLFERFLNPERVSMPDIDIDFDDDGRDKVIDYCVKKYGEKQVAQIVTFGSMAARMAIRDVARVQNVSLGEADKLAKMVPEGQGVSLQEAFEQKRDLKEIRESGPDHLRKTLKYAEILEGSVRHTGLHAAGIIIAPDDLKEYIPVCKTKDSDLYVTQFEGDYIEDAGMLKMDFLGLKTLTILKDSIKNVQHRHGTEIDINNIPLDDKATFELYQRGETIGTFQFESKGMRSYLKELQPTDIEDLIAMNALYRPGPMDFIPDFIRRKHGEEKVEYPHEWLEDILEPTYGIMVFQEQIMQAAQIMADFSLGKADILRRAMGKKKMEVMKKQKQEFIEGAQQKGVDKEKAEEVFGIMEKFAQYGFNRSHSAAYSVVAFKTAYMKANYPAEYMSAVLTHNMNNIDKINFFLDECQRMGLEVRGPDINESYSKFMVNEKGAIRFGLSAIKGVGDAAMSEIVEEREENGPYQDLFDLVKRVNLKKVNKSSMEALVYAGALDNIDDYHRAQYLYQENEEAPMTIQKAIKFGNAYQKKQDASQASLFNEEEMPEVQTPEVPQCDPWSDIEKLQKEKEVTGIYISGHPLDKYKLEIENFCRPIRKLERLVGKRVAIGGLVTEAKHLTSKKGNRFGLFTIEDYSDSVQLALFSEDYLKFKHFLEEGTPVYVKGPAIYNKRFDRHEVKIKDMMLLSEVRKHKLQEVVINLNLENVTDDLVGQLYHLVQENPGNCRIKFKIKDPQDRVSVQMPSRKAKIEFNDHVAEKLDTLPRVDYSFN